VSNLTQDNAVTTGLEALFPDTPSIAKPAPQGDVHRGRVDGVTSKVFDSGAVAIDIALTSLDEGFTTNYRVFVPKGFVENVKVDPNTLPLGTTVLDEVTGKTKQKGNQQQQYARTIRNEKHDAELEQLFGIGIRQGLVSQIQPVNTFTEYVSALNSAITGAQVVFPRGTEANAEPQYADMLRVKRILDISEATNPKRFKGLRKSWE